MSAFAITHPGFPCEKLLDIYRNSPRIIPGVAVLFKTFGEDASCLRKFTELHRNRPHLVEIHLTNGPCRRNGNCDEGELFNGLSVGALNRLAEVSEPALLGGYHFRWNELVDFVEQFETANTVVVVSIELESNFTPRALDRIQHHLIGLMQSGVIRSFPLVSNGHRYAYSGVAQFVEKHGLKARCGANCFANNDGAYAAGVKDFRRYLTRNVNALGVFFWEGRHQGRREGGKFIAPRKRTFVITDADVAKFSELLEE